MKKLELVTPDRTAMHSPVALTFTAEIQRMSGEKGRPIAEIMAKLAGFTGISERQLYNYRSGATDIPSLHIPVLCKQFESNALAMAIVGLCDVTEFEETDGFDLSHFCAQIIKDNLTGGQVFMDAVRDGQVDGHELLEIKNTFAQIVRNAHRGLEVAIQMRERRVA